MGVRRVAAIGLPLAFLSLFFIYPLLSILNISLNQGGSIRLDAFREVVEDSYYREVIWFTLWQAAVSTLLTIGLALPAAYVVTRYRFRGRSTLMALATLPFVLPTVVVAAAFSSLLGDNGIVNNFLMGIGGFDEAPIRFQRTLSAIFVAHVFYNFAIALRMIAGYWANQSQRVEEAARSLGANGWRLWLFVRLPLLRPAILAAATLVYIFSFTSFGIVLILGGLEFATIEVEIQFQVQVVGVPRGLPVAAALSFVQIALMFALMIVYTRLQKNVQTDVETQASIGRVPKSTSEMALVGLTVFGAAVMLFAPLLALVWRSLADDGGVSLSHFTALLDSGSERTQSIERSLNVSASRTVFNSVAFAAMTTAVALLLGVVTAYAIANRRNRGWFVRWLDPLFMLPLATSAVTLGFGYIVSMDFNGVRDALNQWLAPLNITFAQSWDLRSSWLLIPLAHTLVALPFVIRSVLPAIRAIPNHLTEAASVLGGSPTAIWLRVELPLISRSIVVGAVFAFTVSMGEFGASLLIARPETTTIPIAVERLLGRPGTSGEAYAMSVILLAVCAVGFVLIERLRTTGVGEF